MVVEWDPPHSMNGALRRYEVHYNKEVMVLDNNKLGSYEIVDTKVRLGLKFYLISFKLMSTILGLSLYYIIHFLPSQQLLSHYNNCTIIIPNTCSPPPLKNVNFSG